MPASPVSIRPDRTAHNKFVELDVLRSAVGLKAIISQRRDTGVITFAVVREFQQRGSDDMGTTSYIPETLLNDLIDLVERVRTRITELRVGGLAPRAVPATSQR